ncbi:deoxyhypusine synthase-like protein [Methanobrevibacter cuticularis]|uniref:Probable deoxyhypusine synthase n=1 Tax=Methanobrevibacter cuticularis TaxID=47311 RepID=A0A166CSE2_9EURY|nr:deoxyhypusine synthase [Methanobrevibacter cuticularis]KZX16437.1 deoxyhypusine synthase-like protein [Methanobrevibacter cuticularis]
MNVNQMNVKRDMKINELMEEFSASGVLGAGRVGRSCELLANMLEEENMSIFMSVAGPLVPGGLRNIIASMIKNKQIDVLVTSGANITHDLLESFGGKHYRNYGFDDEELNEAGMGRIGDIYTKSNDFEVFETKITEIISKIAIKLTNPNNSGNKPNIISISNFLYEVGSLIDDENSILKLAAENQIPIFAPGLIDSMLGLQLWMFTQENDLVLDALADMHDFSDIVFESPKVGAIILGGGLPKHYTLASNLLRGGLDAAIQITMDRSETGSLSGAPLEEAKSWSKAKCGSNLVSVVGDVTILFPLILAGALDKITSK